MRRTLALAGLAPVVLALAFAPPARAQQVPSDTTPPDSVFRRAGVVLRWQVVARELIGRDLAARQLRPARATFYDGNNNSRLYALIAGAQYDALRATMDSGEQRAAAAAAAEAVLRVVFPTQRAALARALAAEEAALRATGLPAASLRAGERAGRLAAGRWTRDAAAELRAAPWRGQVPEGPGRWRSEGGPPALAISVGLRPWFLTSRDQLRPPPPPEVGTPAHTAALDAVRTATLQRTRAQTRATWAWARNAATLWSEIAGAAILRQGLSQRDAARAVMYLNMALSDATIACWDTKLAYWSARPSQVDSTLDLSIPLPNFPSYPSAHATLFATGAAVLGHFLPAERTALDSVAAEVTSSRVWAGVHYPFDNDVGARMGRQVAELALAVADAEAPDTGPARR